MPFPIEGIEKFVIDWARAQAGSFAWPSIVIGDEVQRHSKPARAERAVVEEDSLEARWLADAGSKATSANSNAAA